MRTKGIEPPRTEAAHDLVGPLPDAGELEGLRLAEGDINPDQREHIAGTSSCSPDV